MTVSPFFAVLCEPPEQKRRPKTAIDAKFCIPFTVAVALAHGDVGSAGFFAERLTDPKLHALADKVHHGVEPGWTFEQSTRGALVAVACGRAQLFARGERSARSSGQSDGRTCAASGNSRIASRARGIRSRPRRWAAGSTASAGSNSSPTCGNCSLTIAIESVRASVVTRGRPKVSDCQVTAPRNNRRSNDRCAVPPSRR